jgi:dTMP kinase
MKGLFLSLEGIDGTGKSTQCQRIRQWLEERGHQVLVLREPGGSHVSEQIRNLLLDPGNDSMCSETELLLYTASRMQIIRERMLPWLEAGNTLLLDRFADSSTAYQGYGRKLDMAMLKTLNGLVRQLAWPDRTWWLDLDPELAASRVGGDDRLEQAPREFFSRVATGYAKIQQEEPDRVIQIDAAGNPDTVFAAICSDLEKLLESRKAKQ